MSKRNKLKYLLILGAFIVIAAVSFFCPEYTENVARAFMLILGII